MSSVIDDRKTWLEARRHAIGASDLAAILGLSPYRSPWDIWALKTDRASEFQGNEATRLGQVFESGILDYAQHKLGELRRNVRISHDTLPLAATLDGQCIGSDRPVEAKTTGLTGPVAGQWGDEGTDQVPEQYLVQVYAQIMCSNSDLGYLFALIPGRGVLQYEIQRQDSVCDKIANFVDVWWTRHIINGEEPSREKASLEIVKQIRRETNKTIALGERELSLLTHIERMKEIISDANERLKMSESHLLASLGDAEIATFPDGRSISYFQQTRKSYVVDESTYRVMRIRKAKS